MRIRLFFLPLIFIIIAQFIYSSSIITKGNNEISKIELLKTLSINEHIEIDSSDKYQPKIIFSNNGKEKSRRELSFETIMEYVDSVIVDTVYKYHNTESKTVKKGCKKYYSYEAKVSPLHRKIAVAKYENDVWGPYNFVKAHNAYMYGNKRTYEIAVYDEEGNKLYETAADVIGWPDLVMASHYDNLEPPYLFIEYIYDNGVLIVSNDPGFGLLDKNIAIVSPSGDILTNRSIRGWFDASQFIVNDHAVFFTDNVGQKLFLYRFPYSDDPDSIRLNSDEDTIAYNTAWSTFSAYGDMIGVNFGHSNTVDDIILETRIYDKYFQNVAFNQYAFLPEYRRLNSNEGFYLYNEKTGILMSLNQQYQVERQYNINKNLNIFYILVDKLSIFIIQTQNFESDVLVLDK